MIEYIIPYAVLPEDGGVTFQVGVEEVENECFSLQLRRCDSSLFLNIKPRINGELIFEDTVFRYVVVDELVDHQEGIRFLTSKELEDSVSQFRENELSVLLTALIKLV